MKTQQTPSPLGPDQTPTVHRLNHVSLTHISPVVHPSMIPELGYRIGSNAS
jgi:hypothetical protein